MDVPRRRKWRSREQKTALRRFGVARGALGRAGARIQRVILAESHPLLGDYPLTSASRRSMVVRAWCA